MNLPAGERAEEIWFDDLKCLDEGEWLNDRIINFAIRRIKLDIDPKWRVFFHGTHLFSSLASKRNVQRWYKNVDLLATDFGLVPINTSAHWFGAIMCNVSRLDPSAPATDPAVIGDDDDEVEVTEDKMQQLQLQEDATQIESTDSQTEHDKRPSQPKAVNRHKRSAPPGRKVNSTIPTIITMDSLGTAHPSEVRILKDYLVAYVKDKRGVEIDASRIQGMTAKNLPQQKNYCDCGLYLIGFFEAFARQPREFVDKLFNRSIDTELDFLDFDPSKKRAELRDHLLALYDEQEEQRESKRRRKAARKARKAEVVRHDAEEEDIEMPIPSSAAASVMGSARKARQMAVSSAFPAVEPQDEDEGLETEMPRAYSGSSPAVINVDD